VQHHRRPITPHRAFAHTKPGAHEQATGLGHCLCVGSDGGGELLPPPVSPPATNTTTADTATMVAMVVTMAIRERVRGHRVHRVLGAMTTLVKGGEKGTLKSQGGPNCGEEGWEEGGWGGGTLVKSDGGPELGAGGCGGYQMSRGCAMIDRATSPRRGRTPLRTSEQTPFTLPRCATPWPVVQIAMEVNSVLNFP
jgi:hypothetical protein